ncbi:MAG: MMPL family transporter [Alteromonadaceae bacterium]|nr:MMPL family transporter [Alteromonadaceae bacterium]
MNPAKNNQFDKGAFVVLLAILLLAAGLFRLSFNTDYRVFFSPGDETLQTLNQMENTFGPSDNILLVIDYGNISTNREQATELVHWVTQESWYLPYTRRVDSISNYQHTLSNGDELEINNLIESVETREGSNLFDEALGIKQLKGRLISNNDLTAINISFRLPRKDLEKEVPYVISSVESLIEKAKVRSPEANFYVTGTLPFTNAFTEATQADVKNLTPAMLLIMALVILVIFRSYATILAALSVILLSLLGSLGFCGWVGIEMSGGNSPAPFIIIALSIAGCVHLINSIAINIADGLDKSHSVTKAVQENKTPIALTSLSTILGFLAINISEVPPYQDLGNMVVVGVFVAFISTIFVAPAILTRAEPKHKLMILDNFLDQLPYFCQRFKLAIILVFVLGITVSLIFVSKSSLNDDFVRLFDESMEFRSDTKFTEQNLTGINNYEIIVESATGGPVYDTAPISEVKELIDWIKQKFPNVHVSSVIDVIEVLHKNLDDERSTAIPSDSNLIAQYLLLYEMSMPKGLELDSLLSSDKRQLKISVTAASTTTERTLQFEKSVNKWVKTNAPHISIDITGTSLLFAHMGMKNSKSMIVGTSLSLLFISCFLLVALRSFKYGVLSIIPNIVPAILGFGVWVAFGGMIELPITLVVAMTLGVVVDDTVHFLHHYIYAKRSLNHNCVESLRHSMKKVGGAIILTSVILVLGFAVMSFSVFEANAKMAIVSGMVFVFAVIIDLLLLPCLILLIDGNKDHVEAQVNASIPSSNNALSRE